MSRVAYNQKGYSGCSMSKRAVAAYDNGEMPKSKWTKRAILESIASVLDDYDMNPELIQVFQKMTKNQLWNEVMHWSSWHHVGKFAQEVGFYEVFDRYVLEVLENSKEEEEEQ